MAALNFVDPRDDPNPPYLGPERCLASDEADLVGLIDACKHGRIYDVERWIQAGRPLQLDSSIEKRIRRKPTPLSLSISSGALDLTRLLLCNGYRQELELSPPLDAALERRRWDLLELLLDWGADPNSADVERILGTYQRSVFELFWNAGVDLEDGRTLAYVLADSTRNRPLYGFVKNYREKDPRIQRAVDTALGHAIEEENEKAISLCVWAGANPRSRAEDIRWGPEPDDEWLTAIERAVASDKPSYLKKLRLDATHDEIQPLYTYVDGPKILKSLVAIEPPHDWGPLVARILSRYSHGSSYGYERVSLDEMEQVFTLGGRLENMDRRLKRDLRAALLSLCDSDAQRLFNLLRDPKNADPDVFIAFIAQEKMAERILSWRDKRVVDRPFLEMMSKARGIPRAAKQEAAARIAPPVRRIQSHTYLKDAGVERLLSREELYDLVWSKPLSKLCVRFGLSDNGVRKHCKKMNVPTPSLGYWRKIEVEKRAPKTPLPPLSNP